MIKINRPHLRTQKAISALSAFFFTFLLIACDQNASANNALNTENAKKNEKSHIEKQPISAPQEPVIVKNRCDELGEQVLKNKLPQQEFGNYAQRADVATYAKSVAQCYSLDEAWVLDILKKAEYKAAAARYIMPQPAGTRNWSRFIKNYMQPVRIQTGVKFWNTNQKWFVKAQEQYGVPAKYILGIIGVETIFGQYMGDFRIVDALSTLTFDFPTERSDRTNFFATELAKYLFFTSQQKIDPLTLKGSYAGAIGMPQFMPSSIIDYAVDFDGDGKINLHTNPADIIGSVANYLSVHGWVAGLPASFAVNLDDASDESIKQLEEPDILPTFNQKTLEAHGVYLQEKTAVKTLSDHVKVALITLPNGEDQLPTYVLGTQNFYVITRYNRSSFYAMSVIELGNAIEKAR